MGSMLGLGLGLELGLGLGLGLGLEPVLGQGPMSFVCEEYGMDHNLKA